MTENNGLKSLEQMSQEKSFKGTEVDLIELMKQDSLVAQSLDKASHQRLGVIQRVITSVNDDSEYRQILKLARWRSQEHIDRTLNAIAACRTCGATKALKFIFDKITAESAGINSENLKEAFEALTHTSTTYDWRSNQYGKKNGHRDRDASGPITQ